MVVVVVVVVVVVGFCRRRHRRHRRRRGCRCRCQLSSLLAGVVVVVVVGCCRRLPSLVVDGRRWLVVCWGGCGCGCCRRCCFRASRCFIRLFVASPKAGITLITNMKIVGGSVRAVRTSMAGVMVVVLTIMELVIAMALWTYKAR